MRPIWVQSYFCSFLMGQSNIAFLFFIIIFHKTFLLLFQLPFCLFVLLFWYITVAVEEKGGHHLKWEVIGGGSSRHLNTFSNI